MFLKRIYRFALKRLIGSFLVNNDLAMKDLDVKLRERTVELRNLNLDTDVLNSSLGLSECRVVSALIENVTLSGKNGLEILVSGVRVVLEPQRLKNASESRPGSTERTTVDENDEDDEFEKGVDKDSSLTEGLSSVESWVEQTMNMLKVQIVDVTVQIRLPSAIGAKFPYYLSIFVESCESQTNLDAAVRQTELYGVRISLLKADDANFEKRLIYIEPSSSSDGRVCLIKAALDETFKDRGYEVWLWAVDVDVEPATLSLFLTFVSIFNGVNSGVYEESPRVRIREDSEASATSGGSEMFFDAQQSFVESRTEASILMAKKKSEELQQPVPTTKFNIQINGVVLRMSYGDNKSNLMLRGRGVVLRNGELSISEVTAEFEDDKTCDLDINFDSSENERAVVFNMSDQILNLNAKLSLTSSNEFRTLRTLTGSYASAGLIEIPTLKKSVLVTPASASSQLRFRIHDVPMIVLAIKGVNDEARLNLFHISADSNGVYASRGEVSMASNETSNDNEVLFLLDKSVVLTFLDKVEVQSDEPEIRDDDETESKGRLESDTMDDDMPPLCDLVSKLEHQWHAKAGSIVDISIASLRTPDHLDPEIYQRFVAVLSSSGSSKLDADEENLSSSSEEGLFCLQVSCPTVSVSFASAKGFLPCGFQARDTSIQAYGAQAIFRVQHLCCMEELDGADIPLIYTSRFASDAKPSVLGLLCQESSSDLDVRIALNNFTYRLEPKSVGMTALSWFLTPDGRNGMTNESLRTDIRVEIDGFVIDIFPSQSPFQSSGQESRRSSGRVLVAIGTMSLAACETLSVLKRYDVEVSDIQVYLAQRSTRWVHEHKYTRRRGTGLAIQEYAELNGLVRIGEMQRGAFYLRAENPTWDVLELEAVIPALRMMTCADSLQSLVQVLGNVAEDMSGAPTATTSQRGGSPNTGPTSPILIMPRSTSIATLGGTPLDLNHIPDSELPASVLRQRSENAPDSTLNARQLQARYHKEPYLLPHIIDDYYSLGSAPKAERRNVESDRGEMNPPILGKHSSSSDLLAEFDIISIAPTPPPQSPATPGYQNIYQEPKRKVVAHDSAPEKGTSQASRSKKRTFADDDDDDDDDSSQDEQPFFGDETDEVPMKMIRSVTFSKHQPAEYSQSPLFHDDKGADTEIPEAVQLISMEEINSKAKLGFKDARELQASVSGLVSKSEEAWKDSNEMAENEANLYKTAILASSTVNFEENQNDSGPSMWQPGMMLVDGNQTHQTSQENPRTVSFPEDESLDTEEPDGAARYFGQELDDIHIRTHHFPVPIIPKAGSFLPPRSIIAARIESGGHIKDVNVRGKYRVILRDCSISWSIFGGADFHPKQSTLYEPIYDLEEVLQLEEDGDEDVKGVSQKKSKGVLVIVEDHFARERKEPLFSESSSQHQPSRQTGPSNRDVNRVVEIEFKGLNMLLDAFGDGAMSLSLAAHDVEIVDAVKSSPVKKIVQHWINERLHPRYTAEDMLRLTVDISAKNAVQLHIASLPIRLIIHQETLELIYSFSDALSSALGDPNDGTAKESSSQPIIEIADFRALKLKVDYYPKRVDLARLRSGRYSELIHLFSYEAMEVALKRAIFRQVNGFAALAENLMEYWAEDVINKQLYQLLAGLSPSLKNIAMDVADIVLLPVDLVRKSGTQSSASAHPLATAKKKAQRFARTIVIEGAGVGRKVASAALGILDDSRTRRLPQDLPDGFTVAGQAMTSRVKRMHQTIVAIPLTEWHRDGATGALKSVVRAIPVAVLQPVLGLGEAIEAISSGVQHHLDPDEIKQESYRWKNSTF